MLRRLSLPWIFVLAALVTMILAAGGVWQLARPADDMLEALGPMWVGIAAVFWVLWRQVAPHGAAQAAADLPPAPLTTDFEPLHLDRRYADLARLSLDALDYVVVDTETTGTDTDRDEIVQIGAVRIVDGQVIRAAGQSRPADTAGRHPVSRYHRRYSRRRRGHR